MDRYHDGGHRNLERIPPLSTHFLMQPGDGVHIYPWAPHWVHNGPSASISLSVTYRTPRSEREELAHIFNGRMRRYGLTPVPAGDSRWRDSAKAGALEADPQLTALKGRGSEGWYFFVTDRTLVDKPPRPEDWKYLRQGALLMGESLLFFSMFSNVKDGAAPEAA